MRTVQSGYIAEKQTFDLFPDAQKVCIWNMSVSLFNVVGRMQQTDRCQTPFPEPAEFWNHSSRERPRVRKM